MSAILRLCESFLGFKNKKSPILEQRNSILKLMIILNIPNLIILFLINTHILSPYMDQQFHYKQFMSYVHNDFTSWEPKLTTPPGLYYIQRLLSIVLGAQLSTLRIINCVLFGNLFALFAMKIYEFMDHNKNNLSRSINLALTPTIYFFNFLDYTDAASLALISMTFYYNLVNSSWRLCVYSMIAVYIRQNNILWISYLVLYRIVTDYEVSIGSIRGNFIISTIGFLKIVWINKIQIVKKSILQILIFPFFIFYIYKYNDGYLVFGDRSNHSFTFHPTQLLYLSLFIFINLPLSIGDYFVTIQELFNRIYYSRHAFAAYLFLTSICLVIVDKFTKVHPFILADNRHYLFYIYRYFGWTKFILCLLYPIFFIFITRVIVTSKEKLVKYILWLIFTLLYLMGSQLVEFRYFAVPFVILTFQITNKNRAIDLEKMHLRNLNLSTSFRMIWSTLGKIIINVVILYVFILRPFGQNLNSRFMW